MAVQNKINICLICPQNGGAYDKTIWNDSWGKCQVSDFVWWEEMDSNFWDTATVEAQHKSTTAKMLFKWACERRNLTRLLKLISVPFHSWKMSIGLSLLS